MNTQATTIQNRPRRRFTLRKESFMEASLGQMLKEARQRCDLSLRQAEEEIAAQYGVKISFVTIRRIENDESLPNAEQLEALINRYGIDRNDAWQSFIVTHGRGKLQKAITQAIQIGRTDMARRLLDMLEAA